MFQSSPSPKAGSYIEKENSSAAVAVSILSQPEGRELRRSSVAITSCSGFNPLPARRPGATNVKRFASGIQDVSILSQPEGRELLAHPAVTVQYDIVSILSQPEGRELHVEKYLAPVLPLFQSSPSPKAGSYCSSLGHRRFSSVVSILSQPEGRELLIFDGVAADNVSFQSSPSPKAGSYRT